MSNQIAVMAERLSIEPNELNEIIKSTIMPSGKKVSNEQFVSFMAVANEYKLNPLVKEIYAFPARGGGIQPVVSIDGWIKIITNHPDFDGMEFDYEMDDKAFCVSVTCHIHRKSMARPISATEYFAECNMGTEPWKKYPRRMLRHKACIQAGRYGFGISGIIDPDEADRFAQAKAIEKDVTPSVKHNIIQQAAEEVTAQEVFDTGCDWIEEADNLGELQSKFATAYKQLQSMNAKNELVTLKDIYDEKKAVLEGE